MFRQKIFRARTASQCEDHTSLLKQEVVNALNGLQFLTYLVVRLNATIEDLAKLDGLSRDESLYYFKRWITVQMVNLVKVHQLFRWQAQKQKRSTITGEIGKSAKIGLKDIFGWVRHHGFYVLIQLVS